MMKNHASHAGQIAHGAQKMAGGGLAHVGRKLMATATKHPLLVFGLGTLAGIYLYKVRKSMIETPSEQIDTQENS